MNPAATTTASAARQWLRDLARPVRRSITLAVLAGVLVGVATIAQAAAMAGLVSHTVAMGVPLREAAWPLIILFSAIGIRASSQWLQDRAARNVSDRVRAHVRDQILAAWGAAGPAGLGQQSRAGLTTALIEQVDALHGYYARFLPQLLVAGGVPLLVLLVVLSHDWLAALFLLLSAPLIPLFMALVGMGAEKLNAAHFALVQRLAGHFIDRIRGLTTLQLFGQAGTAARQVYSAADEYRRLNMRTLRVAFLSTAVLEFFSSVAIAVIAIYIGFGLLGYIDFGPSTELTLFSGLFILLLAPEFFQPLRLLAQHYHDRAAAIGAATHLAPLVSGHPAAAAATPERAETPFAQAPAIEITNLSYRFADGPLLLDTVSLRLEPGTWVNIQGPSGSGKSTLLHLAAGFLTPGSGSIRVAGHIAGRVPIGWLDQSPYLFHGSWADNLRLNCPGASDAELHRTLDQVGLSSRLDASGDGLATIIGERGFGLSGGEARRLALARLLLQGHRLILLDEPTAGLDRVNEQAVLDALDRLRHTGIALLTVSHHDAPARRAAVAMTLENGTLYEV